MNRIMMFAIMLNTMYTMVACRILGVCKDDHDCNQCAGYSWCEAAKTCHRVWEENILC